MADATIMQADATREARAAAHDVPTAARTTVLGAVAVAVTVTVALIVSRRPDALSKPQLWAEGGVVFYQQAHNVAPPILAWLAVLLWSACVDPNPRWRWGGRTLLLLVLLIGVPRDWRVPARVDLDFPTQAARYAAARAGTMVRIPTPPAGWEMWLRKR